MTPTVTQKVNYVAAPENEGEQPRIKKAVITLVEHHNPKTGDSTVRLDHSAGTEKEPAGSHTALATYDESGKTPNTWHYPEAPSNGQRDAAPNSASPSPAKPAAIKKEGAQG
jgi:hypothetical protein